MILHPKIFHDNQQNFLTIKNFHEHLWTSYGIKTYLLISDTRMAQKICYQGRVKVNKKMVFINKCVEKKLKFQAFVCIFVFKDHRTFFTLKKPVWLWDNNFRFSN